MVARVTDREELEARRAALLAELREVRLTAENRKSTVAESVADLAARREGLREEVAALEASLAELEEREFHLEERWSETRRDLKAALAHLADLEK